MLIVKYIIVVFFFISIIHNLSHSNTLYDLEYRCNRNSPISNGHTYTYIQNYERQLL